MGWIIGKRNRVCGGVKFVEVVCTYIQKKLNHLCGIEFYQSLETEHLIINRLIIVAQPLYPVKKAKKKILGYQKNIKCGLVIIVERIGIKYMEKTDITVEQICGQLRAPKDWEPTRVFIVKGEFAGRLGWVYGKNKEAKQLLINVEGEEDHIFIAQNDEVAV